jgi:hypothetical protein
MASTPCKSACLSGFTVVYPATGWSMMDGTPVSIILSIGQSFFRQNSFI